MGEIVYCARCGDRILEADFDKGRAFEGDGQVYCAKCTGSTRVISERTPKKLPRKRPTVRVPVIERPSFRKNWVWGLGVLAVISLVLLVFALRK